MTTSSSVEEILSLPKILFFGGSFDPVHIGHTTLPFEAVEQMWGQERCGVVYVPAARSPHKDSAPTPDEHRVAMLRIGLESKADSAIWRYELTRGGTASYWADTWAIVRERYPKAESRFLIGADQALVMHKWSRFRGFWSDAVVVMREDDSIENLIVALHETGEWSIADLDTWRANIVQTSLMDISSTRIRVLLGDRTERKTRIEGLDPGVQDYILQHRLYRDG
jgi:nicotinate-nucleotide adenylyltransferase